MCEKIFLLGVGCQKGGTTWLHKHISKHPHCDLGFTKEYHVFDALYVDECRRFLDDKVSKLKWILSKKNRRLRESIPDLQKHLDFYENTDNYFDYFESLYHQSKETKIVGDITPSYSALPQAAFDFIRGEAERRGFQLKVIFLMRDPVERCWSAIRMRRRNVLTMFPEARLKSEENDLVRAYRTKQYLIRTRYDLTIPNIESALGPEDIFYGFYEQLFSNKTVEKIDRFLGLTKSDPDFEQKINESSKSEQSISEELYAEIASFYKETYMFCEDRFGISDIWPGYKYLE